MNELDLTYQNLLGDVLYNGVERSDRTNTGTISLFGRQIRHNMKEGFPLLTTKRMAVKTMMTELKWFLKGKTNIKYLLDNNCHIWDGDAYKIYKRAYDYDLDDYLPIEEFVERIKTDETFAKTWGELGPIYGQQWKNWNGIDQIANLIEGLKENPDSRRHLVSAWNVDKLKHMTLPPCHYSFQCYVADGKLSLMWNQRSADLFLGVPFNIASYGTLLLLLCNETGYKPGELIGNFGDLHLYKNHIRQAEEQLLRGSYNLPTIELFNIDILNGEFDYLLTGYKSHPSIKAPLNN